jgi:hypothetical protein
MVCSNVAMYKACIDFARTALKHQVALPRNDDDESKSLEISHLLITEAETDELTDIDSVLKLLDFQPTLSPKALRLLQQELWFPWASIDIRNRVSLATNHDRNADTLKLLLGPGPLLKEYFEVQSFGAEFNVLFTTVAGGIGRSCRNKHGDASWQAFLQEAIGVNAHLCICGRDSSPLAGFLNSSRLNHTKIGPSEQPESYWLESLQRAGANLVEYGRLEKKILKGSNLWLNISIYHRIYDDDMGFYFNQSFTAVHIINLTYGPEPEDWQIWFSWPLDEWAGEFWHMVENPELFGVPGAWIADD